MVLTFLYHTSILVRIMLNKDIEKLADIFLKIKNKSEMINFLYGLLTPKEIEEFSTRVDIVRLLKQGKPQKMIAEKLGIGVATITRGSNEIRKGRFLTLK